MLKTTVVGVAMAVICTLPAVAQSFPEDNGVALLGITEFDAEIVIATWLQMDRDRDLFRENATDAFVLALRREGVRVDVAAPNYLFCSLNAVGLGNTGFVAFVWDVEYYDYNPEGLHTLLWDAGGIAVREDDNFTAEAVAQECENTFANEWLKWNPR